MNDAFSKQHPLVNFLFFLGAICCGALINHPVYLMVGIVAGGLYYLLLHGRKGWKLPATLVPMFVFLTAINPLFNTYGERVLFYVFGRPYTVEALLYGGTIAGIFVNMTLWFGCYNQVLTGDKFTSLFGNLIPSLSLLLVMVLRLVPTFLRRIRTISGARDAVGKGVGEKSGKREKLESGFAILGALTSRALEDSVVTGDSMRARGYGCTKRSSFMIYRMTHSDRILLAVILLALALTVISMILGQSEALFTPTVVMAAPSWGVVVYGLYLLIPSALHIKEKILWHISRSKI